MYQSMKVDMSTINSRIQSRQSKRTRSLPKPDLIKKDYNYYKGNINLWDRPTTVNKKIYQFYHAYNEKNESIQEKAKQLQDLDSINRQQVFSEKKEFIINFREQELDKLRTRKLERKALQYESCQKVDVSLDDKEFEDIVNDEQKCRKLIYRKGFKVNYSDRAPHLWNNLTKQTQKYIDMIVTPLVLKQDERAIETINKNFSRQQLVNQVNSKKALEKHEELRQAFKQRHLQNYLYEKQLVTQNSNPHLSQIQQSELIVNEQELERLNDPDYFPCRFKKSENIINKTRNLSANQRDNYMTKLSKPKEYCFTEAFLHSHSDYKGLLIGEIDIRKASQTDNCFIKTVLPSQVAQKALQEQELNLQTTMRPKTALPDLNLKSKSSFYKLKDLVIPTKTLDDFNQEHKDVEREKILEDIDMFDKNCKKNRKGLGFAKSVFLEAQNQISSDGINKLKEERMMREMIQNELQQLNGNQENLSNGQI